MSPADLLLATNAEMTRMEVEIRTARLLVGDLLGIPPNLAKDLDLVAHLQELVSLQGTTQYHQGWTDACTELLARLATLRKKEWSALHIAEKATEGCNLVQRDAALRLYGQHTACIALLSSLNAEIHALQAARPEPRRAT